MSASPVSSPETLSAERVAAIRASYDLENGPELSSAWFADAADIHALCNACEAFRAEVERLRSTPSERDADELIASYRRAVLNANWRTNDSKCARNLESAQAALRAALLREKPWA